MLPPQTHSRTLREFFFWSGIVATIAYRIINFLTNFDPIWLKATWYIGTIGFVIYFAHRYQISERRAKLIEHYHLADKVDKIGELSTEEKGALSYLMHSLESTKEKWNYIVIFVASGIALVVGIIQDFF